MSIFLYITKTDSIDPADKKYTALLSAERVARIQKMRSIQAQKNSIATELLLCRHIKKEIPNAVFPLDIVTDENGKPHLNNIPLYFSFSHSDNYAICAVSDFDIGADIEKIRPITDSVVHKISALGDNTSVPIHLWSAKEAYLKLTGDGICGRYRLHEIMVLKKAVKNERTDEIAHLYQFETDGFVVSVCSFEGADIEKRAVTL